MRFGADELRRTPEDIAQLCKEMRESKDSSSRQFEELTYEEGVMAAIRWLFFSTAESPYDVSRLQVRERVAEARRQVLAEEFAQTLENGE